MTDKPFREMSLPSRLLAGTVIAAGIIVMTLVVLIIIGVLLRTVIAIWP